MRLQTGLLLGLAGGLVWFSTVAWSQEDATGAQGGTPPTQAKEGTPPTAAQGGTPPPRSELDPAVDPAAIEALEKMGGYLRSLKAMEIKAVTRTDEVLDSGQKIQLTGRVDLQVKRPDRLWASVDSDRKKRQFFYDGETFTLYGEKVGYYASIDAPPTIGQLIEVASKRYGLEFPLADLFYWGTDKSGVDKIQSATYVGPSRIDGVETDHYAFRQADLDWQVWIQRGPRPLPRKLVLTTTNERTQPQYEVELSWDLAPKQTKEMFTFVPPKGALPIGFMDVASHGGRPTVKTVK
jgi:hypothetical protein